MRTEPGKFVLFPSWLEHYVLPHNPAANATASNSNNRIALSFNVRVAHKDDRTRLPPMRLMLSKQHARGVSVLLSQLGLLQ